MPIQRPRHRRWWWLAPILALGLLPWVAFGQSGGPGAEAKWPESGSRCTYVHRFTAVDESGKFIGAKDTDAQPYAPDQTCGRCHDTEIIRKGWHFSAFIEAPKARRPAKNAPGTPAAATQPAVDPRPAAGRPGEPWLVTQARAGVQIPVSTRGWAGTYKPSDLGLTPWDMLERFGAHVPYPMSQQTVDTPGAKPAGSGRWPLAGKLDVDCMACHSGNRDYDMNRRAEMIERQNFRWAPTAALNLGSVRGKVAGLPDDFDLDDPPKDKPDLKLPTVTYNPTKFDAEDWMFFDVVRRPAENRCYACHTTREVGPAATPRSQQDQDIHLRAGMNCSDCHRHGLDHQIARGYESEAKDTQRPEVAAVSCRGCHLGTEDVPGANHQHGATVQLTSFGGKLGAPIPAHKGLPPLHLEKLACVTCHGGLLPQQQPGLVQTSLAHDLGHGSKTRKDDDRPLIQAPVFLRGTDGKIAPHKVVWPAFWGVATAEGKISPLHLEEVLKDLAPLLGVKELPHKADKGGLSADQIQKGLQIFAKKQAEKGSYPVYVHAGKVYSLAADGRVTAKEDAVAAPYAWPMGHEVRGANQALGAGGCTDCHSEKAPFLFGKIDPTSPSEIQFTVAKSMHELQGLDGTFHKLFAQSFAGRPLFKLMGFLSMGIVAAVVLAYGLRGLAGALRLRA